MSSGGIEFTVAEYPIIGTTPWPDATMHDGEFSGRGADGQVAVPRDQSTDRQEADLLYVGVRRDDLYVDHGPEFDRALEAIVDGDTLVITTLDLLGRSMQNGLAFADE